jgi:hypothetical protein
MECLSRFKAFAKLWNFLAIVLIQVLIQHRLYQSFVRESIQQNGALHKQGKLPRTLSKGGVKPFGAGSSSMYCALLDLQTVQVSLCIDSCRQVTLAQVWSIKVQIKQLMILGHARLSISTNKVMIQSL